MSRVSPVYKEDIKSDPNKLQTNIYFFNYRKELNYKKIIEKIVFGQRYGYLVENNLLVHSEHDFRPLHFNKRGCFTLPVIPCKHAYCTYASKCASLNLHCTFGNTGIICMFQRITGNILLLLNGKLVK